MGCFDMRESGNISYSSEASYGFKMYTTPEGPLCQCYQMDVAQVTPKQHSINVSVSSPKEKQHMFDVECSHDISNKTPHLLFPAIKYR